MYVFGRIVSFVGIVLNFNQNSSVMGLYLENYLQMMQQSLIRLLEEAREHWPLQGGTVIHRIGDLSINDQIVLILVSSVHRKAAIAASEFLIDELKTRAPFWKKERLTDGSLRWVKPTEVVFI